MKTRPRILALAAVLLTLAFVTGAEATGQLTEYYIDWARSTEGASIASPCTTIPGLGIQKILDPVKGEDGCIFADGIEQREEFTIDLGKERQLGQIMFITTTSTVYEGELKRKPNSVTVGISNESAQGPWKTVYTRDPADVVDTFALDNVPARWLHFDLGVNKDGVGSRVSKVKIFKRYLLKPGPELMKTFHKEFRRDAEGLGDFWKAVDARQWDAACDAIIEHYSHAEPEPRGDASPRVKAWMQNVEGGEDCVYKFDSADWDWFQLKSECPHSPLGIRPGGYTILHLLTSAYAATGETPYIKQLAALLRDWLQDLPCPGAHRGQDGDIVSGWAGLNASNRASSFGRMVRVVFPAKEGFDRDLKINLLYSVWEHCTFLHTISPELGGNWLTNVNANQFEAAIGFPEMVQQKQWLEDSKSTFELSMSRDVHPSGKEKEDSTMYVPIASGQLLWSYSNMRKAKVALAPEAEERMARLYDCLAWMHYPDRSLPAIGDAHREVQLIKEGGVLPAGYLDLFDRPDLVYINTQGKQGTMPAQASRAFSDGGWYIMRTAWDTKPYEDARQMFFKCATTRGHGHPDQLEVTVYAYGREIITDPGMASYGTPWEANVVPTSAHSTICVDEKDQSVAGGTEKAWVSATGADFVDGEFQGYKELYQRRQIIFLKPVGGAPDYWLIHDDITGVGNRKLDLNFHLSEGAKPKLVSGSVCTTYPSGGNALIRLVDQSVKPEIVDSSIAVLTSVTPTKTVRYRKEQAPPTTFDTVILPYKGAKAPAVATKLLKMDPESADKDAIGVRVATDYGFDAIVMSTKPGSALSFENGRIKTDGSALVIRVDKKGKMVYAFQAGGTHADYRGKRILNVEAGAGFREKQGDP
ncbi:MAG: alginate lyase family protein [Armatimonadota bacterium]|nr:alginate lyase family protein [Armatimonadota bacterium]